MLYVPKCTILILRFLASQSPQCSLGAELKNNFAMFRRNRP